MRRPWLFFVPMAPLVALFVYLAADKWRSWHDLGEAPRAMAAAEALREAQAGRRVWVELTGAHFVCEASGVFGEHRYAPLSAPGLPESAPLLIEARGVGCPPPGEPLVGVAETVHPKYFANVSGALRARAWAAGEPAIVDMKGGASHERSDFIIISIFVVFFVACGGLGYLLRSSETKLERRTPGALPTAELAEALGRGPLRWRAGAVAQRLLMALIFVPFGVAMVYVTYSVASGARAAFFDEPRRWPGARPVATLGPPGVVYRSHSDLLDDILATVEISWQPAAEPGAAPIKLDYGVLKVPELRGPVEVRVDDQGYLTNVGVALASQRALSAIVTSLPIALLGGALGFVAWRGRREFARQRAARRALLERPRPVLVPLLGQRVVRQGGFADGQRVYDYEAPSGARRTATLGSFRRAALDDEGERVLVVVPEGDDEAEPILVAEDGYPFALERARP